MSAFKCQVCGLELALPIHCGGPMKADPAGGEPKLLVCEGCGFETDALAHHGKTMKLQG